MRRVGAGIFVFALVVGVLSLLPQAQSQSSSYKLDTNWPQMPAGMFFGTKAGFAEDRKESPFPRGADGEVKRPRRPSADGTSGLAIDDEDNVYVINRGVPPIMVFDKNGKYIKGGGEKDVDGKDVSTGWTHSGGVDREGNVWLIERDGHRILKFPPKLDKAVLQIGTTDQPRADATHLNLPSGIAVLHNGNIVVTDGYGNNRVVMFDKYGKFVKQAGKGAGARPDVGTGNGEFSHPHKLAVDADDNIYVNDRGNKRIQVFDKNLNYVRQFGNDKWVPWDITISRKGTEAYAFVSDNAVSQIRKISLKDGTYLDTFGGGPGRKAGQFDGLHGIVVDSAGVVYGGDTFGQRVQKFVPVVSVSSR